MTDQTTARDDTNLESGNPKGTNLKKFINAWESSPWGWHVIFLISCVIGVLIDPLFLYIPIINEDDKCLGRDETMKNVALILRSTTDFAYLLHFIVRLRSGLKMDFLPEGMHGQLKLTFWKGFPWWYLLNDILAILPFPQVVVLVFFSKMAGSKTLTSRKFLNILLLAQYVPRILRIYFSAKELGRKLDSLTERLWVKGAFYFFLYIIAGHVFGAFWYFYSIFRETACWHRACNRQNGCDSDSSFYCRTNSISTKNSTYFNMFCPVNPPNSTVFDFGIFANAIESGTLLGTTKFPRKFSKCFWWGLRNLSSLGSNLETSSNIWENLFAVLISTLGLLLFLYLIGNLQHVAEFVTKTVNAKKLGENSTLLSLYKWLSDNGIPDNMQDEIMQYMRLKLQEVKDIDVVNILGVLPHWHVHIVRKHLCLDTLKKVPMVKNKYGVGYGRICKCLKPVTYSENTYIIRKGEPLDMMLFITQGIVWSFNETSMEKRLQKGDYFGEKLLEWVLSNPKDDFTFPISTKNVKAHTKVEAFALRAANLEPLVNDYQWIFDYDDDVIQDFAAARLQRWWYRIK